MAKVDSTDIIAVADIAELFEVTSAAVSNWKARNSDFPKPITTVARGKTPLYSRRAVLVWYHTRNGVYP